MQELFPAAGQAPVTYEVSLALLESAQDAILALAPKTPQQDFLRTRLIAVTVDITAERWRLFQEKGGDIPPPFLAVLIFWFAIVFASFGLFAPPNATAIAAMMLCSMAVAGGLMMILELDTPYSGILKVSVEPMRQALAEVAR